MPPRLRRTARRLSPIAWASFAVTATDTFTSNSSGVLALPLAMHSTARACSA